MKKLWIGMALCAGFALVGVAQAQAPANAAQKAAAEKAAAAKAKEAEVLGKAQDKAVANYKRNKGGKK